MKGMAVAVYDEQTLNSLTDSELVLLAQQNNTPAMEIILSRYKPWVCSLSSKFYMQGYDKEDIIQEGMIGLFKAIIDYKKGKSSFKSFAGLCITRKIISALKSSKRQKHIPLNSSISLDSEDIINPDGFIADTTSDEKKLNPESIIIGKENLEYYESVIKETLSTLEQNVLKYHMQGLSYKDIAQLLSKDIKAVDNAVQRIKKKLISIADL